MMKVKMLRNNLGLLENDINEFLEKIGSQPGFIIELNDIKLTENPGTGMMTAMVIYNQRRAQPPRVQLPKTTPGFPVSGNPT